MHPEHKRPLAAFVLVSATSAVLLSQSLFAAPDAHDGVRPASSAASNESTGAPTPDSPANGHAVDGVTASPTELPVAVKTIGRTPTIMAVDDDGLGVSTGANEDPEGTPPSGAGGAGPTGGLPSTQPDPTSTGEPDPDPDEGQETEGSHGGHGPKVNPPKGPWSQPELPPIGPGNHPTPSASGTGAP